MANKDALEKRIRSLSIYLLALTILVLSAAGLFLVSRFNLVSDVALRTTFDSVLDGMIASAIIAMILSGFSDANLIDWIRSSVSRELQSTLSSEVVSAQLRSILNEMDDEKRRHFPSHIFNSTLRYDPRFNDVMRGDFSECSFFSFHGQTARYVALRMQLERAAYLKQVLIRIPYPCYPHTIETAIAQRKRLAAYAGQTVEEVRQALMEDIRIGLAACFESVLSRPDVTMVVAPMDASFSVRSEVMDGACYVSMYDTDQAAKAAQPESVRYGRGSMLHKLLLDRDRNIFDAELIARGNPKTGERRDKTFVLHGSYLSTDPVGYFDAILSDIGFDGQENYASLVTLFSEWKEGVVRSVAV